MSHEIKSVSTQEFADSVLEHRRRLDAAIEDRLPGPIKDLMQITRAKVRAEMKLNPEDIVVVLGEQAHGLHKSDKILGKRFFAKDLETRNPEIKTVELFATHAPIGSKPELYRMHLPNPTSPDGFCTVNVISGWKKRRNGATAGFRSPTKDELQSAFATLSTLYGKNKAETFVSFTSKAYEQTTNYALGNVAALRELEAQIGLEIQRSITEDVFDTKIAQSGGMEIILSLWPRLVEEVNKNLVEGVRPLEVSETPFQLYHECEPHMLSRMKSTFEQGPLGMETKVNASCFECPHTETTTASEIVSDGRHISWKAIPRVVLYSMTGAFDGHITGGGSVYNETAGAAFKTLGLPYFPLVNMSKYVNGDGPSGIFTYSSAATQKSSGHGREKARLFVKEGKSAMVDLLLSIGTIQLKEAVEKAMEKPVTTVSRVLCPDPLPKDSGDIIF